jgi:signal recognition particle subunit SRP54
VDESQLGRIEAIICSMTPEERADPAIIDGSRRIRIAQGSGTAPQDVNALLKQFKQVSQMMKQLSRVNKRGKRSLTGLPPGLDLGALGAGGGPPGSGGRRR